MCASPICFTMEILFFGRNRTSFHAKQIGSVKISGWIDKFAPPLLILVLVNPDLIRVTIQPEGNPSQLLRGQFHIEMRTTEVSTREKRRGIGTVLHGNAAGTAVPRPGQSAHPSAGSHSSPADIKGVGLQAGVTHIGLLVFLRMTLDTVPVENGLDQAMKIDGFDAAHLGLDS